MGERQFYIIDKTIMSEYGNHLLSTAYQKFVRYGDLPSVDDLLDRMSRLVNYKDNNLENEDKVAFANIEIEGCKALLDIHNKKGIYED